MSNITKQEILEAIRKTAKENAGKPLGKKRFRNVTGIKVYDWEKYWARFGDLLKEAGFEPNQLQKAYTDEFIINKMIGLIRKFNKFPVPSQLRIERTHDSEFPNSKVFFDSKVQKRKLAERIIEWCKGKKDYNDIIEHCLSVLEESSKGSSVDDRNAGQTIGEVYLYKSGRYYKIGKTIDTVRRGSELRIQLPEKLELIHSIKTDDPSGVEVYWHKRFALKRRQQSEWFDLSFADIKAFKLWRRIV